MLSSACKAWHTAKPKRSRHAFSLVTSWILAGLSVGAHDVKFHRHRAIPASSIKDSNWIEHWGKFIFGFLVAASAPLLYIHGLIYYQSYLEVFGLEPAMFSVSKEETFVHGYFAALSMATSIILALIGFAVGTTALSLWFDSRYRRGLWREKQILKSRLGKQLAMFGLSGGAAFVCIVCLAFTMLGAHRLGVSQANQQIKGMSVPAESSKVTNILVSIESKPGEEKALKGQKIVCSEKWCAFWVDSKIEAYPVDKILRLESIVKITEERK